MHRYLEPTKRLGIFDMYLTVEKHTPMSTLKRTLVWQCVCSLCGHIKYEPYVVTAQMQDEQCSMCAARPGYTYTKIDLDYYHRGRTIYDCEVHPPEIGSSCGLDEV